MMEHRQGAEKLGTLKVKTCQSQLSKLNPARAPVASSSALKLKDIPDVEVDTKFFYKVFLFFS